MFALPAEDLLDARLRADWHRSFQLSDPTFLAQRLQRNMMPVLNPGATPDSGSTRSCRFEVSPIVYDVCALETMGKIAASAASLIGYVAVGTVLAQIPTKSEVLDLAWEQDGVLKTASLEVPPEESNRILRTLRSYGVNAETDYCSSSSSK